MWLLWVHSFGQFQKPALLKAYSQSPWKCGQARAFPGLKHVLAHPFRSKYDQNHGLWPTRSFSLPRGRVQELSTWRLWTSRMVYLLGEPASLLVVTNTYPPLSLFSQQLLHPLGFCPSHPFTPHSSNYIIYIDGINNLGCLRPGQEGSTGWGDESWTAFFRPAAAVVHEPQKCCNLIGYGPGRGINRSLCLQNGNKWLAKKCDLLICLRSNQRASSLLDSCWDSSTSQGCSTTSWRIPYQLNPWFFARLIYHATLELKCNSQYYSTRITHYSPYPITISSICYHFFTYNSALFGPEAVVTRDVFAVGLGHQVQRCLSRIFSMAVFCIKSTHLVPWFII